MATLQQRAAVEKLVEQGGKSISRAMRESKFPYSPQTAKTPKKLTKSKGFREILIEQGLTEELIRTALVADIQNKPGKRVQELNLGADILSMKKSTEKGGAKIAVVPIYGSVSRHNEHSSDISAQKED